MKWAVKYRDEETEGYQGIMFCFRKGTPKGLQKALLELYLSEDTVRIDYGDMSTGQSWGEEHDVFGIVRRSAGEVKVPLLIPLRERGGQEISHVVRILVNDGNDNWGVYWQHDNYTPPKLYKDLRVIVDEDYPDVWTVAGVQGAVARFDTEKEATKWMREMAFFHSVVE